MVLHITLIFIPYTCRLEAFREALGRHRHAQHVEQMAINDIEVVVNTGAPAPYTRVEIISLLEVLSIFYEFPSVN